MKNKRKFIAAVLSVCVIATTIFAASPDITQATSKTKYYSGMPKAIGVMELSDKQITSLSKSKDLRKLSDKINTVADCVRYFKKCKFKFYGSEDSGAGFLKKRKGDDFGSTRAFAYLLANDYDEIGTIYMRHKTIDDFKYLLYVKTGDKYYAVDPSQYLQNYVYNSKFMGNYTGKNFYSSTLKGLKSKLVKGLGSKYKVAETEVISKISDDMLYYDHQFINIRPGLDKDKVTEAIKKIVDTNYSSKGIKALVEADMTLEEASEKLTTVHDAVNYLRKRGFEQGYSYNPGMKFNGVYWSWNLSAEFTFEENSGCCGGISNLMNRLMAGNYDSQGYVTHANNDGGHIFNYFYQDGLYFVCDFIGPSIAPFCEDYDKENNPYSYILYVTDDMTTFDEYYRKWDRDLDDEKDGGYLIHLFCYEMDGKDKVPVGHYVDVSKRQMSLIDENDAVWTVVSDEIEETLNLLMIRDGFSLSFEKAPTLEERPPEVNIPDDNGNITRKS